MCVHLLFPSVIFVVANWLGMGSACTRKDSTIYSMCMLALPKKLMPPIANLLCIDLDKNNRQM